MTPEEKRALLKRELLKEALAVEAAIQPGVDSAPAPKQFSMTESGLAGAAQGLGSNFLDELYGARKGVQDAIVGDASFSDIPNRYRAHRDEARQYYDEAQSQNPGSYATGNIGGGIGQALIPGAGLTKLGPIGGASASAAAAGLGDSDKESTLANLDDAAKAGTIGAAFGAAGTYLPGAKGVRKWSNEKAVKASGAMTKEMRALESKGLLQNQGEFLLKHKIVTPLASLEDVAERSEAIRKNAGEKIGSIIDGVDNLREQAISRVKDVMKSRPKEAEIFQKQISDEFGYNYNNVANRIEAIIARDDGIAASKFHRDRLGQISEEFRRIGSKGSGTLRSGLRNKTEHRRLLKDVDNLGEEYKQEVYDVISDELNRSVGNMERLQDGVEKLYGSPVPKGNLLADGSGATDLPVAVDPSLQPQVTTALDEFGQANRDYAASAVAQATAESRLGQVRANRDYGMSTGMATAAGLVSGGPGLAVAYGGLNNFFRKYGSSLEATGGRKLANLLETQPEAFGQYAAPLGEAMRRGPRQFVITNYLIGKQDPEYATFLDSIIKDETKIDDPEQLNFERQRIKDDRSMNSVEKAKRLSQINRDGFITVEPPPAEPAPQPVTGDIQTLLQSLKAAGAQ